ncbi:MAG: hypothetical protein INR71_04970 [Terriglobus roseus]|nr:hypothetical protein [Terriglobus roseus]
MFYVCCACGHVWQ